MGGKKKINKRTIKMKFTRLTRYMYIKALFQNSEVIFHDAFNFSGK